jgi:hypothetical protein
MEVAVCAPVFKTEVKWLFIMALCALREIDFISAQYCLVIIGWI